jgi:hypothetical protein
MKALPIFFAWVAALTWCVAATAQKQQLDIVMEGPWIYYQDDKFIDASGTTQSVLVAMAPTVGHLAPTFTTGHGGKFPRSGIVYCLGDGRTSCITGTGKLSAKTYPGLQPISVNTKSGWKWYTTIAKDYWYVILPMPDSASNDGVDVMFLESDFQTPVYAGSSGEKGYSIGLQLHYKSWPTGKINLISCTDFGVSPTADKCDKPDPGMDQDQLGTLHISMAGMEEKGTAKKCSYHLRTAYHRRILFLDDTPLGAGGNNVNRDKEYSDLRSEDTDDYDATCYRCDPQNPKLGIFCPRMQMSEDYLEDYAQTDAKALLGSIVVELTSFADSKSKEALQIDALKEMKANITGRFPSPEQLFKIQGLLELSVRAVQDVYLTKQAAKLVAADSKASAVKAAGDEQELLNYIMFSATSGKDCKAAQMLITSN